MLVIIQSPHSR